MVDIGEAAVQAAEGAIHAAETIGPEAVEQIEESGAEELPDNPDT